MRMLSAHMKEDFFVWILEVAKTDVDLGVCWGEYLDIYHDTQDYELAVYELGGQFTKSGNPSTYSW